MIRPITDEPVHRRGAGGGRSHRQTKEQRCRLPQIRSVVRITCCLS